jgi:hypothetical protein
VTRLVIDVNYGRGALSLEKAENFVHHHGEEHECLLATVFPYAHGAAKDSVALFSHLIIVIEKDVESQAGVIGLTSGEIREPVDENDMALHATRLG